MKNNPQKVYVVSTDEDDYYRINAIFDSEEGARTFLKEADPAYANIKLNDNCSPRIEVWELNSVFSKVY